MRSTLSLLALILLTLAGCGGEQERLSSIVVITIDTLRADHLASYGYYRTTSPVIDELAAQGVLFENAMTTSGTTQPSHTALWSSRYPIQTGVTSQGRRIMRRSGAGDRVRFFSQMLQEAGYSTAAFVSATPVKKRTGIGAGFDVFDEPEVGGRKAPETTQAVLDWLEAQPQEPFFAWVHYFDPHKPYDPPAEYAEAFSIDQGLVDFLHERGLEDPIPEKILAANNGYDAEIFSVDAQIARIISALETRGDFEDVTFVVTSDHGEGLGQHGRMGHGAIYNEQLFVPLIMKFPARLDLSGRRESRLVSLIDVVPTLVETLDLPIAETDRERFTGVNALSKRNRRKFALAQRSTIRGPKKLAQRGRREIFGLVSLDWKYIARVARDARDDELYDMRNDRDELNNLIYDEPEIAEQMRHKLLTELATYRAEEPDFDVIEENMPEVLDELRALGYLK